MDREAMGPRALERIVGQDPQLPQGFYPVTEGVRFLPGDQLTVTCEFDSMSRTRPTYAGSTSKVQLALSFYYPQGLQVSIRHAWHALNDVYWKGSPSV